jgi:mRNA-degrading endonuclease toxin of MazEF toxin-antitoxin module
VGNPFKPGNVYYADVPETGSFPRECRDNPDKGPRPWIILYCRQHARTGVVLAAPLYTKGELDLASHVACIPDHFDLPPGDGAGLFQPGFIHLEQLRALDKKRLKLDRGPLACMKQQPFYAVRAALMGMFEPRLLPT